MTIENQIISRLNALVGVGYKIDYSSSQEVDDALWLMHPAKQRAEKPELILYSNGLLVSQDIGNERNQLRIENDELESFNNFIRTVPMPNFWEKTLEVRGNLLAGLIVIVFCGAGAVLFNVISSFITKT